MRPQLFDCYVVATLFIGIGLDPFIGLSSPFTRCGLAFSQLVLFWLVSKMTQPAYVTSINRRFHRITNRYCDAVKCRFGPKHAFYAVYCCLQDWSGGDRQSAMGVKTRDLTLPWDKKKSEGRVGLAASPPKFRFPQERSEWAKFLDS
jgi:hypothetical protein